MGVQRTFHWSGFSCIAEQIVVCQYHRSWRKCGGDSACACRHVGRVKAKLGRKAKMRLKVCNDAWLYGH